MRERMFLRILFMGSADFGIHTLDALIEAGHRIVGVVSTPARPRGRGLTMQDSPVTIAARRRSLEPVICPESLKDPALAEDLSALGAELFVVVAFRILPPAIFSIPPYGTVNIHASLLPRFRGPAPIQRAIEAGERESGVTIFRIDEGIDTGGVILQRRTAIGEKETTPELYERLSRLGAEALLDAIERIELGKVEYQRQDAALVSKAPKLKKAEARIDWQQSARTLFNRIRAFKPFPGSYAMLDGKRLGVIRAEPIACDTKEPVGTVAAVGDDYFDVVAGAGCLRIYEVKPEGRKQMSAGAFVHGRSIQRGTKLQ
jgi:methionyl-tRNA formyltransferase